MSPNSHCKHTENRNTASLVRTKHQYKPQLEAKVKLKEKKKVRLTWQGKKGENPEWDHAQLSETILHSNYVNQDLL